MPADGEGTALVLLAEWHVSLYVPANLDDTLAEEARRRFDNALRRWAEKDPAAAQFLTQVEQ
jgi:hypothetical protein